MELEGVPRNRKIFIPHSKESSKGQNRVSDSPGAGVEDEVFNRAEVLIICVYDGAANHRLCGNDIVVSGRFRLCHVVLLLLFRALEGKRGTLPSSPCRKDHRRYKGAYLFTSGHLSI